VKRWWIQPLVRLLAAMSLPFVVPAVITGFIWALPGDPASLICPPHICGGTEALADRWNLNDGAIHFFLGWMSDAVRLDFGNSWRLHQGLPVLELLQTAIPATLSLIGIAAFMLIAGAVAATKGWLPRQIDPFLRVVGLVPALVLALAGAAFIELTFGFGSFSEGGRLARLLTGAAVLGFADGAFTGAALGSRATFELEANQRYVGMAVLRGESTQANTFPNVAPALIGQMRARIIHLLSGAVVVEVVLRIDGIGSLLWGGTLRQDFGVVLAAGTLFAVVSAGLLLLQAVLEAMVAIHVRRAPDGVRTDTPAEVCG
jgi:ABC-type dipeptide/oligopeptide/nickel transport system permease component